MNNKTVFGIASAAAMLALVFLASAPTADKPAATVEKVAVHDSGFAPMESFTGQTDNVVVPIPKKVESVSAFNKKIAEGRQPTRHGTAADFAVSDQSDSSAGGRLRTSAKISTDASTVNDMACTLVAAAKQAEAGRWQVVQLSTTGEGVIGSVAYIPDGKGMDGRSLSDRWDILVIDGADAASVDEGVLVCGAKNS